MRFFFQISVVMLLSFWSIVSFAQQKTRSSDLNTVAGFRFGHEKSPSGAEWQSPEDLSLNKEFPHAYFFSFDDEKEAINVLPESSSYWKSLDGAWKFHWVKTPEERVVDFYDPKKPLADWTEVPVPMSWNIFGIQKDGSLKYGVPIYVNQKVIFQHEVKVDDWKGGVMRTPPEKWTTYQYRNEVGAYRREFSVPKNWKDREVFINFDGVDSFFYLWINGRYVGFSKNSRQTASFNITPYLNQKGENTVAVEVYRNSDASFIEAQDMFRLPGIFRTVSISSKPKISISDLYVNADLTDSYQNGKLTINAQVRNSLTAEAKGYSIAYSLYENELYSDEARKVAEFEVISERFDVEGKAVQLISNHGALSNPKKWSAEEPYRYTLVATLKDKKGRVTETVSTIVGFRKVEIKDTPADEDEFRLKGRYFYVNGKPVKLKGVNRHETNPETGKVISRDQMEKEIMLMKRANINHVRNSHYTDDPYWYYLCNKYGIYLEDEANIESHEYYYGEESLSHPKEWKNATVARSQEMVYSHRNHPSVVIWSLGNEAGPGNNFVAAYDAIKKADTTRPVQYERNNSIVDMGSNQYPSIDWVREAVKGTYKLKYPFHISEYAHSMGNATGNLIDYWEAIESSNFFMGGAIWDWIDQAMYTYDRKTGEKYLAYGGDFGDYPNDGTFVNNGLIFADLTPKPAYFEVKKVYQNIGVTAKNSNSTEVEIFNKNYFTDLSGYEVQWVLYRDGLKVKQGVIDDEIQSLKPRKKATIELPIEISALDVDAEYFVKIQFSLISDRPWAQKGFVQMDEQLKVKSASDLKGLHQVVVGDTKLQLKEGDGLTSVSTTDFSVRFNDREGTISSLEYGKHGVIQDGEGPKLDVFRAPVDNDNWTYQQWFSNGLHNLKHKVLSKSIQTKSDGTVVIHYIVQSQAPNAATIRGGTSGTYTIEEHTSKPFGEDDFKFTSNQVWTVYRDGTIELSSAIVSNNEALNLARIGYSMQLPTQYSNYQYYGRGPHNNYNDRKTSQFIEQFESTVENQFVPWPNPQSMSNNEEVRWASLTDANGDGVIFIPKDVMSTSALAFSEMDLTLAPHPYQLPKSDRIHVHLDAKVTGLGGNSCGQGPPLEQDRVKAIPTTFGFAIRPIKNKNWKEQSKIALDGDQPILVSRNQIGEVKITKSSEHDEIYYQIDDKPASLYVEPIMLREGGKISAWSKRNPELETINRYAKIENVPTKVIFASSEETYGGSAQQLVDGNADSFWHTMYSVTVAQYPHWVDFDAGEEVLMKGFSYLPRQDGGRNGAIKDFKIQVSADGKNWGESVIESSYNKDMKAKRILFKTPVKARYLRFTALSSQDGQDFASGAEFQIIAD